jgi:hypothetical protein
MFDFIKNIGGKKSNNDGSTAPKVKKAKGYFLELDETGNTKSTAPAKQSEATKAESVAEVKQAEATPTAPAEPAAPVAVTAEAPKAETKPEAKKPEATKAPTAAATVKIEAQPNPPAPAASNGKVEPQAELTFAPNYLLPKSTNSRRRPGPSMNTFLDMARQVKTR